MTYETGNPVPSTDPRDLDDNAQAFDRFLMSLQPTEPDRLGVPRRTWSFVEAAATALTNQNVIGLAALVSAAGKAFRFTNNAGAMATYDISALGITLAGIADQAAGRAVIDALGVSENAVSASALNVSRSIAITGDATWSVTFDGSSNVSAALTLANTGVAAGTYGAVTVDVKGRVTSANVATPIANGGTGATSAAQALVNLGLARFTSTDQAIGTSLIGPIAHGLGAMPNRIEFYARCLTAEAGWVVGEVISLASCLMPTAAPATPTGVTIGADNTNIRARIANGGLAAVNSSTGTIFTLTPANWRIFFKASL